MSNCYQVGISSDQYNTNLNGDVYETSFSSDSYGAAINETCEALSANLIFSAIIFGGAFIETPNNEAILYN